MGNQNGFNLISVLMATAIASVVMLAITSILQTSYDTQLFIQDSAQASDHQVGVKLMLSKYNDCKEAFINHSPALVAPLVGQVSKNQIPGLFGRDPASPTSPPIQFLSLNVRVSNASILSDIQLESLRSLGGGGGTETHAGNLVLAYFRDRAFGTKGYVRKIPVTYTFSTSDRKLTACNFTGATGPGSGLAVEGPCEAGDYRIPTVGGSTIAGFMSDAPVTHELGITFDGQSATLDRNDSTSGYPMFRAQEWPHVLTTAGAPTGYNNVRLHHPMRHNQTLSSATHAMGCDKVIVSCSHGRPYYSCMIYQSPTP